MGGSHGATHLDFDRRALWNVLRGIELLPEPLELLGLSAVRGSVHRRAAVAGVARVEAKCPFFWDGTGRIIWEADMCATDLLLASTL